jgi:hypothetical protein
MKNEQIERDWTRKVLAEGGGKRKNISPQEKVAQNEME